jgi:hypothetical protein
MRPSRFPRVNDVMLAEAMRQILPLAATGMTVTAVFHHRSQVMRAEVVLDMRTRQERGRIKSLGGPLPKLEYPPFNEVASDIPDPGQIIPVECQRPSRRKKRPSMKPKPE